MKRKGKEREGASGRVPMIAAVCGPARKMFVHKFKGSWCAKEAETMYKNLKAFLSKNYPGRKRWLLVEDNDPSGLQTKRAKRAKAACGFTSIGLPKRSPDLSPMDYAVWDHIVSKMRAAEKRMRKKESRKAHIDRLVRTIKNVDKAFLKKTQRSMRRRLQQVLRATGGLIEE